MGRSEIDHPRTCRARRRQSARRDGPRRSGRRDHPLPPPAISAPSCRLPLGPAVSPGHAISRSWAPDRSCVRNSKGAWKSFEARSLHARVSGAPHSGIHRRNQGPRGYWRSCGRRDDAREKAHGGRPRAQWLTVSPASAVAGMTIGEANLRVLSGATIVAAEREGVVTGNPGPDVELRGGDRVALIGRPDQLAAASVLSRSRSQRGTAKTKRVRDVVVRITFEI